MSKICQIHIFGFSSPVELKKRQYQPTSALIEHYSSSSSSNGSSPIEFYQKLLVFPRNLDTIADLKNYLINSARVNYKQELDIIHLQLFDEFDLDFQMPVGSVLGMQPDMPVIRALSILSDQAPSQLADTSSIQSVVVSVKEKVVMASSSKRSLNELEGETSTAASTAIHKEPPVKVQKVEVEKDGESSGEETSAESDSEYEADSESESEDEEVTTQKPVSSLLPSQNQKNAIISKTSSCENPGADKEKQSATFDKKLLIPVVAISKKKVTKEESSSSEEESSDESGESEAEEETENDTQKAIGFVGKHPVTSPLSLSKEAMKHESSSSEEETASEAGSESEEDTSANNTDIRNEPATPQTTIKEITKEESSSSEEESSEESGSEDEDEKVTPGKTMDVDKEAITPVSPPTSNKAAEKDEMSSSESDEDEESDEEEDNEEPAENSKEKAVEASKTNREDAVKPVEKEEESVGETETESESENEDETKPPMKPMEATPLSSTDTPITQKAPSLDISSSEEESSSEYETDSESTSESESKQAASQSILETPVQEAVKISAELEKESKVPEATSNNVSRIAATLGDTESDLSDVGESDSESGLSENEGKNETKKNEEPLVATPKQVELTKEKQAEHKEVTTPVSNEPLPRVMIPVLMTSSEDENEEVTQEQAESHQQEQGPKTPEPEVKEKVVLMTTESSDSESEPSIAVKSMITPLENIGICRRLIDYCDVADTTPKADESSSSEEEESDESSSEDEDSSSDDESKKKENQKSSHNKKRKGGGLGMIALVSDAKANDFKQPIRRSRRLLKTNNPSKSTTVTPPASPAIVITTRPLPIHMKKSLSKPQSKEQEHEYTNRKRQLKSQTVSVKKRIKINIKKTLKPHEEEANNVEADADDQQLVDCNMITAVDVEDNVEFIMDNNNWK